MRINCDVHILNRQLPSLSLRNPVRTTRSSLAIGKEPGKLRDSSDLFLHICNLQNKHGQKYKIANNIKAVFTRYTNEGKFTIQLKEPPHDITVNTDPTLVKGFLNLLKCTLSNCNLEKLHFSHLNAIKDSQIKKPVTKMSITVRKEYPITSPFPHKLEILSVTGIQLNRIERRITSLKNLHTLDLSDNKIAVLPKELSMMCQLVSLKLQNNILTKVDDEFFNGSIKNSLKILDLSHNTISHLPLSILKLKLLTNLILNGNQLTYLPYCLYKLTQLKLLSITDNCLKYLPDTLLSIHLESIDVTNNPFCFKNLGICYKTDRVYRSLKELAALSCLKAGLMLGPPNLPLTLYNYLDKHSLCSCRNFIIEPTIIGKRNTELRSLARSVSSNITCSNIPIMGAFCSYKCWDTANKHSF